jgi:hypothetical protein
VFGLDVGEAARRLVAVERASGGEAASGIGMRCLLRVRRPSASGTDGGIADGGARWKARTAGPAMKSVRTIEVMRAEPVDARGRRPPADVLARAVRDHLLRVAAARFCVGMRDRPAASFLRTKLIRYHQGAWRRDRVEVQCPARHRGTINELLWTILSIRDAIPCDRTIRAALALEAFSIAH